MKGLNLLKTFNVDYNVLCTVNNINAKHPLGFIVSLKSRKLNLFNLSLSLNVLMKKSAGDV